MKAPPGLSDIGKGRYLPDPAAYRPRGCRTGVKRLMCPNCNEPMVVFEFQGVEVDHCLRCRGTWLDWGEYEELLEATGVARDGFGRAVEGAGRGVRSARRCPRCGARLRTVFIECGDCVEVDKCPHGDGFWFDRGEMRRIALGLGGAEENAVARFFGELYRTEMRADSKGG